MIAVVDVDEGNVRWIETNQLDDVGTSVGCPLVDGVVAVAGGVDVGVATADAFQIVVATLAVDRVGAPAAIDILAGSRAAIPRRSLNLASIPDGAVGEQDLFDAVGAVELVLNTEDLPSRIDLNLEMIAVVDVDEGNVRWIETNQLDDVGTSVGCPFVDGVGAVAGSVDIGVATAPTFQIVVAALAVDRVGARAAIDVLAGSRAAIPRRGLNLASIPGGAVGEQDLFDAVGAVELVLNTEDLPCRIDLNLEMIAVVDVDEGNVRWIESQQSDNVRAGIAAALGNRIGPRTCSV